MAMTPAPDIEEPNAAPVASNVKLPSANTASSATGCCIKCGGTSPFNWCKDYDCPLKYKFAPDIEGLVERLRLAAAEFALDGAGASTLLLGAAAALSAMQERIVAFERVACCPDEQDCKWRVHQAEQIRQLRDLMDRAYKMMEMAGYCNAEHNPERNNPVIAWMADVRSFLADN